MVVSLSKCLLTMLDYEYMTDIVFDVQGQQFKCHKLILSSCETRLKEMVAKDAMIKVDDDAPHTFQAILKSLYSDDCGVTDSNVFELMHAAKIYKIGDLENSCSEFIIKELSERNVSFFTSQALHFDAENSLKVCLDFFKQNTLKVLDTEQFLDIPREVLQVFLENKSDDCSEARFFTACFSLAKAECKRKKLEQNHDNFREVLGEKLIKGIKYEEMKMEEFLDFVVDSQVLTKEEIGQHAYSLRKNIMKVTVQDHEGKLTTIKRERDLKIKDIKRTHIWNEGKQSYEADRFTLSHNRKKLNDEMTLRDVDPSFRHLFLRVETFKIMLHDGKQNVLKPFVLRVKDLPTARSAIQRVINPTNLDIRVLLGNSDKFGYNGSYYESENDPPKSYHPGKIVWYRWHGSC